MILMIRSYAADSRRRLYDAEDSNMSTPRLSSRIASSSSAKIAAAAASSGAGIAATAPRAKRRRKDTPPANHANKVNDAPLPTKLDCDNSNSGGTSGDVKQQALPTGGKERDNGSISSSALSVVMVQVPEGFSFAQAACRCLCCMFAQIPYPASMYHTTVTVVVVVVLVDLADTRVTASPCLHSLSKYVIRLIAAGTDLLLPYE